MKYQLWMAPIPIEPGHGRADSQNFPLFAWAIPRSHEPETETGLDDQHEEKIIPLTSLQNRPLEREPIRYLSQRLSFCSNDFIAKLDTG
ncbi:hypothetical protein Moror_14532 [Moniliophthora roreri MCA 2997]|uniref:Uncharacterized protein n=1 Tax=Moniliophthora roreri (strain MCA 2997) TaxID=1381753 RepID=V2XKF2_MONRO|nr:hypothetical protein Moror_14532 [Moniliophthora roreri MCA 2997]